MTHSEIIEKVALAHIENNTNELKRAVGYVPSDVSTVKEVEFLNFLH